MIPFKPILQLTVPPTLEKWLETLGALRTLQAQDEELVRWRRNEIAALHRDIEELQRNVAAFCRRFEIERSELRRLLKYNPDQPRVPAGSPQGGQWTGEGAAGASSAATHSPHNGAEVGSDNGSPPITPINDSRIISDATPENTWTPGAQYAAGGIGEEEYESRSGGPRFDGTPGQEARQFVAETEWRDALSQVRRYDPAWQPRPSLSAPTTIEGNIARLEAETREAKDYLGRLRELATPRDRNTGEPISRSMTRTGDPFVDSTTDRLNEILDIVVARNGPRPDLDRGQYGTLIHEEFKKEVRAARLRGIEADDLDKTFGVEEGASRGAKDSVRPDVVLRDDDGNIAAIYDVKTGRGFYKFQVIKYRQTTGADSFVPLFELHPGGRTIWKRQIVEGANCCLGRLTTANGLK